MFSHLLRTQEFDQLIARYPLRESGVFDTIARALEFKKKELYWQTLIARIQSDEILAGKLRERIGPLSLALGAQLPTSKENDGLIICNEGGVS